MFCVNERLLALWNQHGRFQLLCQPTLEQEFLIDQPADVRQQASPFVVWHEEHPS